MSEHQPPNPSGLCMCGCGQKTRTVDQKYPRGGYRKGDHRRYLFGHQHLKGGVRLTRAHSAGRGYRALLKPNHPNAQANGYVREHIAVAAGAMGKAVPPDSPVHHVNGDRSDNRPENLVVCESHSYHSLLHARARAYQACGNASYRRCRYCREWDDPKRLWIRPGQFSEAYHRSCHAADMRLRHAAAVVGRVEVVGEPTESSVA